jgi:hypothetical protein
VYRGQLRLLSKLINERETAHSLSADNLEESPVTTVEQNSDDIISPKKLLSENHEHRSVENESVNQMN